MNPGPAEEVGKIASGVVDALREQPLLLILLIINLALVGFLFYAERGRTMARSENTKLVVEMQKEMSRLLATCVVPPAEKK